MDIGAVQTLEQFVEWLDAKLKYLDTDEDIAAGALHPMAASTIYDDVRCHLAGFCRNDALDVLGPEPVDAFGLSNEANTAVFVQLRKQLAAVHEKLTKKPPSRPRDPKVKARQHKVEPLAKQGKSRGEIATELGISVVDVKNDLQYLRKEGRIP